MKNFVSYAASAVAVIVVMFCRSPGIPAADDDGPKKSRPNIILLMSDDQGWGDTGYNGHPTLKTPHLDAMAAAGIRFERWYAGAPVCSPTRGSCLTGRSPYRYGVRSANVGHLPEKEVTLAESLRSAGYTTGHFGKWHLGTLTRDIRESNRGGPQHAAHYSPPWENGFDVCFSTEAKVPTYDPMKHPERGGPYGTFYWTGPGNRAESNLEGDDSRVIMDRVIPFIDEAVKDEKPFFAVVWFHTPHLPLVSGEKYRALYPELDGAERDYYACLTAMDEQIGRLRKRLRELGAANDTMVWFCSDNGPEGKRRAPGSTGGLRGRKRSLYEGGIRVPGLVEWPSRFEQRVVEAPCFTSDYMPTILHYAGVTPPSDLDFDGSNLAGVLEGRGELARKRPITIQYRQRAVIFSESLKLIETLQKPGKPDGDAGPPPPPPEPRYELYDIVADPAEKNDLSARKPEIVELMRKPLADWQRAWQRDAAGGK